MKIRFCVAVLAVLPLVSVCEAAEKPNVVFVLADDLGRNDVGFMGGTEIKTPNIDRLAADGVVFDAHYVQPLCSPTRAALMTGRYPMRYGLQEHVVRPWASYGLPTEERTLAQALKEAGYETAISGKWHLGHRERKYLPTNRGFDHQYGHYNGALDYFTHMRDGGLDWHRDDQANRDKGYSTHLIGKEAVRFIKETAGKKPFFLYVPFNAVHGPYEAPKKYLEPYGSLKGNRKIYAGMLAAMDEQVGKIVEAVEQAGVRDNTLFIFSSDNGGPAPGRVTDNGKYRAGKATLYEGGVRVCAFATWDGHLKSGSVVKEPVHVVDWYPTLLKLCGGSAEQPLALDGRDIWATLTEGKPSPHEAILMNTEPSKGAVRVGDWKLVVYREGKRPKGLEPVELFDLKSDPYEKTNLAEKEPGKVDELRRVLREFHEQAAPSKYEAKPAKDFKVPAVWGESDSTESEK